MRSPIVSIVLIACASLYACALPPKKLQGPVQSVTPAQASTNEFGGAEVRWGGVVAGERYTDDGLCLEVVWFPLDRYTFRPVSTALHSSFYRQPHFLACGSSLRADDLQDSNGTVTAVGILTSSKIYAVNRANCVASDTHHYPVYLGTIHAASENECVITLPVLMAETVHAWPELPSNTRPFSGACSAFCK